MEPTRSQNNTVKCRRSPTNETSAGIPTVAGAAAASAAPQSAQNLALAGVSAPHFGHLIASGLPHSAQNRFAGKLLVPHFGQRISPHPRLIAQLIEQRPGILQISGIETFAEPFVDLGEHGPRFVALTIVNEQTSKADGCA